MVCLGLKPRPWDGRHRRIHSAMVATRQFTINFLLDCQAKEELQPYVTSTSSVTRLGDLLHFGQLFIPGGNNYFAQIAHIVRQFLKSASKSFIFLVKSFLGNFYRHLATFYWSHCPPADYHVLKLARWPLELIL